MRRPSRRVAALLLGGTTVAMALALAPVPAAAVSVISQNFTITTTQDPVTIEARYYRPSAPGTYPVVLFAHGGGGSVNSDAWRAHDLAQLGFVGVVWSARGHGNSGGFYDLFGPKTVQDTKDILTWVLTNSAQTGADPARVGSAGYSQGGGTTNLAAALDPRIQVTAPGNTFSGLPESLKPNGCLKFSVDGVILGLAYTAMGARLDQDLVARWSAYLLSGINAPNPALGRPAPSVELEQRSPATMSQP